MTDEEMIAALRQLHDAFNRGDVEAAVQLVRPDIEYVRAGAMSRLKGVAAMREWMKPDAFEEQRSEPLEFRVNGDKAAGLSEQAMSRENVQVVRQICEAFDNRDWEVWESQHHPDFEWSDPPEAPGGGTHRGVGDVRRSMEEFLETGDDWHVEVDAVDNVAKDQVLMRGRSVFVGRVSGFQVEDPLFQLLDLENDRVRRVRIFRSSREALKAAGLRE
jgi:ketosteroid isomerase-like protein